MGGARAVKSVGESQHERGEGLLVFGIEPQDVFADARGLLGLVQETITVRFFQCRRDRFPGQGLEFEHGSRWGEYVISMTNAAGQYNWVQYAAVDKIGAIES